MCSDREADPIAFPYLKAGYQAFILRYSVGKDSVWPNPMNDYEEAMELIREKSEEWHVLTDKIAVIGFSAGGILAGCAATMSEKPSECGDSRLSGYRWRLCQRLPGHGAGRDRRGG